MLVKLSVENTLAKAKAHAKKGDIAEAKNLYNSILKVFPNNKNARKGLAFLNRNNEPDIRNSWLKVRLDNVVELYKRVT